MDQNKLIGGLEEFLNQEEFTKEKPNKPDWPQEPHRPPIQALYSIDYVR